MRNLYLALLLLTVSVCGKDNALPAAVVNSTRYSAVHSALMDLYSATAGSGTNDPLLNAAQSTPVDLCRLELERWLGFQSIILQLGSRSLCCGRSGSGTPVQPLLSECHCPRSLSLSAFVTLRVASFCTSHFSHFLSPTAACMSSVTQSNLLRPCF